MFRVIEEGIRFPLDYKRMDFAPHIALVNNIYSTDYSRLNIYILSKGDNSSSKDIWIRDDKKLLFDKYDSIPSGHILICKVFYPGSPHITIESK